MKKIIIIIFLIVLVSQAKSQSGSYAGAFARMGFGAKGLSMGNAMTADVSGENMGYYNPSLSVFQKTGTANLGYTFMTLDRKLNFVGFTQKFSLSGGKQTAGLSLSWLNAGVSDIDGRDNDTREIGLLSTYENQFLVSMGFLVDPQIALGIGFKLYHSKLYDEVTTTRVGIDAGVTYIANKNLSFGLAVRDIGVKYRWETSKVYGSSGTITENKFPVLVDFGGSYLLPEDKGVISLGFTGAVNPKFSTTDEFGVVTESDRKIDLGLRAGAEYKINDYLKIRAGVDRVNFKNDDFFGNIKPGAGIGLQKSFTKSITLGVDYSFQLEPYTHKPMQNVGLVFKFK